MFFSNFELAIYPSYSVNYLGFCCVVYRIDTFISDLLQVGIPDLHIAETSDSLHRSAEYRLVSAPTESEKPLSLEPFDNVCGHH